ncbi:MAG TPA: hypothetical protein DHW61_04625 [Lachnoclostridium phytofermentans]|uniref:Tail specific protease domain-containing protein n=1 Tax=Lachnoclostridium phytofermentans TaxID=66219 RepID=A0A3D2X3G6_9FIRM|nr:S41 family peptidase [Lachnoclostridium sp.]HCL01690.1 hypothetical protein [Lachnoclostridium phytofermentans]
MEETQLDLSIVKSDGNNLEEFVEVRPWQRFWARGLDNILFILLVSFLLKKLLQAEIMEFQSFLIYLLAMFIWTFIEAILLCTWGTTPGKFLFNVTIRNADGEKLGFVSALKRSLLVWIYGIGFGIPVISIIGLISQYKKLTKMKSTTWDRKMKVIVRHDYLRGTKTVIIVTTFASIVISRIYVPLVNEIDEQRMLYYETPGSAISFNSSGYSLMDSGEYQKAKEQFLMGLDANPTFAVEGTLLNNLSWACFSLGEYDEALKYSEESLAIDDHSSASYTNYANALSMLGNNSEAEEAYKKALDLDKVNAYAYYGIGMLKYDDYAYKEAIDAFSEYTRLKKKDADGWCYLGLSYLYNKDMVTAKECLDKAMKISPEDVFIISSMANYYRYVGDSQKAEDLYKNALEKNQDDYDLLYSVAEFYQDKEKYDEAIQYADRAINADESRYKAYGIKAQIFFWQGEKQKAIDTIDLMISNNLDNAYVYYVAGNLYMNEYEYKLAVENYDKALEMNPLNEDACIGKIRALYFSKRYTACLKYALIAEDQFINSEISWYIGNVYSRLSDSAQALEHYKKALEKNEEDAYLLMDIGWEYYYTEDFANASLYADKALQIDETNSNATNLKKLIEKRQTNVIDQVTEFIEKNYMYYKSNASYTSLKNSLKTIQSENIEDISKLFDSIHKDNDSFSFMLSGEDYKHYLEYQSGKTVEHEAVGDNINYIRITSFSGSTANEFLDVVDGIENTEDKYLIIDLRGNGGGDTNSGCDILDFLLPDCVVCNLIYKDGYSDSYYSDDAYIPFKHIFVLTDENSASCSELVTLGLKTYLDNVTVIGRKTFGKGVGQFLFEDKTRGFVIFLVNHYWNVREENIMGKGIEPDIEVLGDSIELYMNEVYNLTESMQ